jgi:YbbR domain-containing protein
LLRLLQQFIRNLPTFLLAFSLAVVAWISAVSLADPTEVHIYARQVPIELIGQDPGLVLLGAEDAHSNMTLSAPRSIWDQLNRETDAIRAVVDLSGLGPGTHTLPVQIQIAINPVRIVSYSPENVTLTLDALASRTFPIRLVEYGELAVGFQGGNPVISETVATVSGPEALVNSVQEVRALLDISQATENIHRAIELEAIDSSNARIEGVTLSPREIDVEFPVTQMGGYRNVVVKAILIGQVASGYRVTNISVFPPAVTVFSSDPQLVEGLPGYVETLALDLNGVKDDLDVQLELNLPAGISIIGDRTVEIQVGVAAIEGSITLENMNVEFSGLGEGLTALASPAQVDIILSGPLPVLDSLTSDDVHIVIDMEGVETGIYQRLPRAEINISDVSIQASILPGSIEVTITLLPSVTPSGTGTPRLTPTVTPVIGGSTP